MKDDIKEINFHELFHEIASYIHKYISNLTFVELINFKLMLLWLAGLLTFLSFALMGITTLQNLPTDADITLKLLLLNIHMYHKHEILGTMGGALIIISIIFAILHDFYL